MLVTLRLPVTFTDINNNRISIAAGQMVYLDLSTHIAFLDSQYQPSVRPVIQLNLELPASMSHKDIEALISLVTEARSSTKE